MDARETGAFVLFALAAVLFLSGWLALFVGAVALASVPALHVGASLVGVSFAFFGLGHLVSW